VSDRACSSSPDAPAEAEKANIWEDAPGDGVVPSQTVEAETDEQRRHWPLATRVRRGMMRPVPVALNKHEAVGVDRHGCSRNMVSRTRI
jgi:hypothetical protein